MVAQSKLQKDFHQLSHHASQVMADISNLTREISEDVNETAARIPDQVVKSIEDEIAAMGDRLATLRDQLKVQSRKAVDHVQEHPYSYTLVALGIAALAGGAYMKKKGRM